MLASKEVGVKSFTRKHCSVVSGTVTLSSSVDTTDDCSEQELQSKHAKCKAVLTRARGHIQCKRTSTVQLNMRNSPAAGWRRVQRAKRWSERINAMWLCLYGLGLLGNSLLYSLKGAAGIESTAVARAVEKQECPECTSNSLNLDERKSVLPSRRSFSWQGVRVARGHWERDSKYSTLRI